MKDDARPGLRTIVQHTASRFERLLSPSDATQIRPLLRRGPVNQLLADGALSARRVEELPLSAAADAHRPARDRRRPRRPPGPPDLTGPESLQAAGFGPR